MFKGILKYLLIFIQLLIFINTIAARPANEKVKAEIRDALEIWNKTAKNADVERCLSLFDDGDQVMLIGSDIGEIKKTPYRFTGIMIRKSKDWKWRLFNGSIPRGE